MLKEFMGFLKKFNVIPIAVGLILALSFQPFVDAVVDVIIQLIGIITGTENPGTFVETLSIGDLVIGPALSALISFVIIAFVVFMIVKSLKRSGMDTDAAATPDQQLLAEIRDLLKN